MHSKWKQLKPQRKNKLDNRKLILKKTISNGKNYVKSVTAFVSFNRK